MLATGERTRKRMKQRERGAGKHEASRSRGRWLTLLTAIVAAGAILFLVLPNPETPDVEPPDAFQLAQQPSLGSREAPVTVVEFGDFKCPHCAAFAAGVFPRLKADYVDTGKVVFYFINYPFLGPDSTTAAIAAEAVFAQDPQAGWTFYEALYQHQGPSGEIWATPDFLIALARRIVPGIDHDRLARDLDDPALARAVEQDYAVGRRLGVQGVPTVFVNGRMVTNWSYENLRAVIERELEAVGE